MKNASSRWLISIAMLLLGGCGMTVTWQEEVQLSDGQVIVVERETVRDMGGPELAHGGSGTYPKERRIRFEFPNGSGQHVEWRSAESSQGWPEIPLILDIESNIPFVMTLDFFKGCMYYTKYMFLNGSWTKKQMSYEITPRKSNLFLKSGPNMPKFVALIDKEKENSDIRYAKSMRVVGPIRSVCATNTTTYK